VHDVNWQADDAERSEGIDTSSVIFDAAEEKSLVIGTGCPFFNPFLRASRCEVLG